MGFDGNLSCIMYCPRVMTLNEIYNNYKLGPDRMTIFTRVYNKIKETIGIKVNDNNLLSDNINEEKCGKLSKEDSEEILENDEKLEQAKKDYEEAIKRKKMFEER